MDPTLSRTGSLLFLLMIVMRVLDVLSETFVRKFTRAGELLPWYDSI
jgi:hypothetical protein